MTSSPRSRLWPASRSYPSAPTTPSSALIWRHGYGRAVTGPGCGRRHHEQLGGSNGAHGRHCYLLCFRWLLRLRPHGLEWHPAKRGRRPCRYTFFWFPHDQTAALTSSINIEEGIFNLSLGASEYAKAPFVMEGTSMSAASGSMEIPSAA
jgi:hypothetical protein